MSLQSSEVTEETDQEGVSFQSLKKKAILTLKSFKTQLKYLLYHKTKGRSYFLEHTCSYWASSLLWLLVLYLVVAGFFIAYLSIVSETMPFSFLVEKHRDLSSIPKAPTAGVYFGQSNSS